jgi:hypothetical protein
MFGGAAVVKAVVGAAVIGIVEAGPAQPTDKAAINMIRRVLSTVLKRWIFIILS